VFKSHRIENIRELAIENIEENFKDRITHLVNNDRVEDADSIFYEFVVDGEEPEEWTFMEFCGGN
jgi:hypothetical protein